VSDTAAAARRRRTVALAFVAFISLGLPDALLGVAWPSLRASFGLPLDALGALLLTGTIGYLVSSSLNGPTVRVLGVGGLLAASCFLTGACFLGFIVSPAWWCIVALALGVGLGAGAIDAGLNTYVAAYHGERTMQWLHASYGIGAMLGPFIMTAGLAWTASWRAGYAVVGGLQILLAGLFLATLALWQAPPAGAGEKKITEYATPLGETLREPRAWLSVLLFFLYTGIEIGTGLWIYSILTGARGVAPAAAGVWTGSYYVAFTGGRVLAGVVVRRTGVEPLVRYGLFLALAGILLVAWNPALPVSLVAIPLIGLAVAPVFPGLVSATGERVGARHAVNTIGWQMTGAGLGGALLPWLLGALARRTELEAIPIAITGLLVVEIAAYLLARRIRPVSGAATRPRDISPA